MTQKNKSYVKLGQNATIEQIVEKRVISDTFCVGGYGFAAAEEFVAARSKIASDCEVYVSHVILQMIVDGHLFFSSEVREYEDLGTLREFRHYQRRSATLFCDIDGVLFQNSSSFAPGGWNSEPVRKNVEALIEIQKNYNAFLVVTTTRPQSIKEVVVQKLESLGLRVDDAVFGLPHCRRVLINDYSNSNPYPSASAISLARDSEEFAGALFGVFER